MGNKTIRVVPKFLRDLVTDLTNPSDLLVTLVGQYRF